MKKKFLAVFLAGVMVLGLAGCGNSNSGAATGTGSETSSETGNAKDSYDQVTFAYATFNNIPTAEDLDVVEEAINEITREKIGTEVTLMPIGIAEYSSKVSLSLQGGEKIDIIHSLGDFNNCVATDMAYDISELIYEYGAGTAEVVSENWLDACRSEGKLYGVPVMKPVALTPMVIYRQDIADELGLDMSGVNSIEDLTPILEQVKAAKPEMTPVAAVQTGEIGVSTTYGEVDFLTDHMYTPIGVLMGNDMTVTDLYSTDLFRQRCNLVRGWYNDGLVMKDAATTTSMSAELMASGNYFCDVAAYSYPEADTAAALEVTSGGYPLGAKMIGDAYLSTGDINALSYMVASTTDVPEAAMKFLNLTYTDVDVLNLIIYGIEGRDYVLDENGFMSYPEGEDSTTVPYTAQLSCGTLGNYFLMYPMQGTDPGSLEWELEQNQTAKTSPAMGFTFDSSSLKTQYTAVNNVIAQYLPGLICGSIDPDTEIEKFVQDLNDAGYQDILKAKQEQLSAWTAAAE